jgi:hypothetical protein
MRPASIVTVTPNRRIVGAGDRPVFQVTIENKSKVPLNFRTADIQAAQVLPTGEARGIRVHSYADLVEQERSAQVGRAILVGVASGLNSATTPNRYWAQARASDQNAAMAETAAVTGDRNMAALEALTIKDHTLMPGESYGGQVHLDPPAETDRGAPKKYMLALMVGPDRHEVEVIQAPQP